MTWRQRASALMREPLVHFLLAGLAVFWLLAGRELDPGERRIVVNETVVARLAQRWEQTYHRPPAADELDGLIRDYVKDEVYYREGLRLGLDQGDEVVMRRMRSKMVALVTADAEAKEPSDAQLEALLKADPARYAGEAALAFDQVYLGADTPERRAAVSGQLAALIKGAPAGSVGQPSPLPEHFDPTPASEVSAQLGEGFAAQLVRLPKGQWQGPIVSGFGLHLVRLTGVTAPSPPTLDSVRQRLVNDWHAAALQKAEDDGYRKMLAGYDVVIEKPR